MHTQGCGLACVIVCLFLSACHSGQSSLESQIKEDLHKVLNSAALKKELSGKLTSMPPDSRMLNEAHVEMYVLVRVRAMQLSGSLINSSLNQLSVASKGQQLATEKQDQLQESTGSLEGSEFIVDIDPEISPEELTALNELELSQELYVWVKQTIEVTVEFVDATGDSAILDIVTLHDPAIKHNISLIENFQERLRFANSDALKVSQLIYILVTTYTDPAGEYVA
jgi:hypothetical protein